MRIKSYFAPSVQSAISIARKEFGDEVTLVTSHMAALESRHLGDYEVVFAVDEPAAAPAEPIKPVQIIKAAPVMAAPAQPECVEAVPAAPRFEAILEEALVEPFSTETDVPAKLEQVRTLLLEMGIDAAMLKALMTMIERTVGASSSSAQTESENAQPEAESSTPETPEARLEAEAQEPETPEAVEPPLPDLTPAELAFYLSVSVGS